ncbi:MAG: DUF3810 domain-containing protein [Bacteroidetes bacterium]|nr:DUF3810 domain-containing protein [Bacteroidota bacterium]MBS1630388.1 DUF3810 domain-containing protein [Bacteroidota bacterium]
MHALSNSTVEHPRKSNEKEERKVIGSDSLSVFTVNAAKVPGEPLMDWLNRAHLLRLRYRRKAIFLAALLALVFSIQFIFPQHLQLASLYNSYIFRPFQSLRSLALGSLPFSLGDVLYLIGLFTALAMLIRWAYLLAHIRSMGHDLAHSLINTLISLALIYLLFFIGWGGNYYRPTLSKFWALPTRSTSPRSLIYSCDSLLVQRLNALAPHYHGLPFQEANRRSRLYYNTLTDARTKLHRMKAKASLYGYFMQYLGIQGYYNPFTGEAQVNSMLPEYMLPFVVCHEMAHQSGIAAEDDANLLAYAICTSAPDTAFAYSGYFNLWLYAQGHLHHIDSQAAKSLMAVLNPLSRHQLDTLKNIRREYRSWLSDFSSELYDRYLRLHDQKKGIESYGNVVFSAWALEQRREHGKLQLRIP